MMKNTVQADYYNNYIEMMDTVENEIDLVQANIELAMDNGHGTVVEALQEQLDELQAHWMWMEDHIADYAWKNEDNIWEKGDEEM